MAIQVLTKLIDKEDNFEMIRDQVAQILADESANQQALAYSEGKPNPEDWKFRVFTERSNPIEEWLNIDPVTVDRSPIINVWVDNMSFDKKKSNVVARQMSDTVINVDCYAIGISASDGAGHVLGDEASNKATQKAVRLVRNILMAAINTYLQLRGDATNRIVGGRFIRTITFFQSPINAPNAQQVTGGRIALDVDHNELSPQVDSVTLAGVDIVIKRAEDGSVLASASYDYPITP